MKNAIHRYLAAVLAVCALCAGCGSSADTGSAFNGMIPEASASDKAGGTAVPSGGGGGSGEATASDASAGDASAFGADDAAAGTDAAVGEQPAAGTLTAGDWNDNLNFSWFVSYLADMAQANPGWATLPLQTRVLVHVVTAQEGPVGNAHIRLLEDGAEVSATFAGTDGRGVVLAQSAAAKRVVEVQVGAAAPTAVDLPQGQTSLTVVTPEAAAPIDGMDVAFIVDTTGSMGDELDFLKVEVEALASNVKAATGGADLRFGLVLYRDMGDEYVSRTFDFTTDITAFKANIGAQEAAGGGDTPEAVQEGFKAAGALSWRTGNVARVAIHVADASPHDQDFVAYYAALEALHKLGVRVFPVASSGHDDGCEYVMRAAAALTVGRYVFLTDDSGVGVAQGHAKPHIPCFDVELLLGKLVRLLTSELQGSYIPADPKAIISSSGGPVAGVCTLDDGSQTYIY